MPDLGSIELVAESMEDIKALIRKFSNPDPIRRGRKVLISLLYISLIINYNDDRIRCKCTLLNHHYLKKNLFSAVSCLYLYWSLLIIPFNLEWHSDYLK